MKRKKNKNQGQLPLPLKYDSGKKVRNGSSADKITVEEYKDGECHCNCVRCEDGYHCHNKKKACGM